MSAALTHPKPAGPRWLLALAAATLATLTGCGGGDDGFGECPAPAPAGGAVVVVSDSRPVTYGTSATWFTGPIQAAPADVSAQYGQPLVVCP